MTKNTTHYLNGGIQVSADNGTTWYTLTDDNRQPVKIGYEVIEKTSRMADGTLRRYVVARKHKISSSWQNVWSKTSMSSDSGKAGAWIKSFYEANVFFPILVRITAASTNTQNSQTQSGFIPHEDQYIPSSTSNTSTNNTYSVFITNFDYEVVKRNRDFDMVNVNIEFTEI